MPYYNSPPDNCQLHYVDYRPSPSPTITLIFLHGWPMSHLMYSHLFLPLLSDNIRIIAPDRRGFGKSEYTGSTPPKAFKITYDTFAFDTLTLMKLLCDDKSGDLGPFVFVGASMGCGETLLVYNMLQGKAKEKCRGFFWMGPSLPLPLQTTHNPTAPPRELWNAILAGLREDRYGFTNASMPGIFGVPKGIKVGDETLRAFGDIVAQADAVAMEKCIDIITARDFAEDLKTLAGDIGGGTGKRALMVLHGDMDQGMPYEASSKIIERLVPGAEVKVYEKAAHGLYLTHKNQVLEDLLKFVGKLSAV